MIVASGFMFEEAITELQEQYPEIKFVMIDGAPTTVSENSVGICFVAALQTQSGKVGFIGGMKSSSIERFGYGYVAGVAYANQHLGTDAEVADYVYNGTFDDVAGGQAQAGSMYDKGIDIIFTAAGRVGNGVITEAKTRSEDSENVYVIGVDIDQYELGKMPNGESVILTSAIKRVDNASYDKVKEFMNGTFQGGEVITMNAQNNGVGLPENNPNLTEETQALAEEILENIKLGNLSVPSTEEEINVFLSEMEYEGPTINF